MCQFHSYPVWVAHHFGRKEVICVVEFQDSATFEAVLVSLGAYRMDGQDWLVELLHDDEKPLKPMEGMPINRFATSMPEFHHH